MNGGFIYSLVDKKEIPYGAFIKNGSNCARFVTDVLMASCNKKKTIQKLKSSNYFTPSPTGNVIKGNSDDIIYDVINQKIELYKNRSILREYKAFFLNKFEIELDLKGTEEPNLKEFNLENGTWLGGIGSGAWFKVDEKVDEKNYKISRYNDKGIKDFESIFTLQKPAFNHKENHIFLHPTNCKEVFIQQNNNCYSFKRVEF